MAKFRYRMQNILDIKEKMENQAKTAYGMANAKLAAEQQKLQDILIRRAGYESKARELVSGSINVLEIRECRKAIDVLKSKQRSQMMNVHAAERDVELARKQLNEAMVERKTHEKLSVIPITIMDSVVRQFERTGGKYGRRKRRSCR